MRVRVIDENYNIPNPRDYYIKNSELFVVGAKIFDGHPDGEILKNGSVGKLIMTIYDTTDNPDGIEEDFPVSIVEHNDKYYLIASHALERTFKEG